MKIVHTADWHWSEQKLEKCQQSADFIIGQLDEIRPAVHIIAGDYWDRRQVLAGSSAVLPAVEAMKRMASISPVILILGNHAHDAAGSLDIFQDLRTRFPIYVTERATTIALRVGKNSLPYFEECIRPDGTLISAGGVEAIFYLMPYPTKSTMLAESPDVSIDESNLMIREIMRRLFLGFAAIGTEYECPKVLAAHCNVIGARISSGQTLIGQDIAISRSDLEIANADYYALGHIHVNQEIAPRMHYAGSIYHNNFGESENKYFNVVEIRGADLEVIQVAIPSRPLSLHDVWYDPDTNELVDQNEVQDWEEAELRIRVHGVQEGLQLLDDDFIRTRFPGAWSYKIERIATPENRIRSDQISSARTLREKVKEWGCSLGKDTPGEVLSIADEVEKEFIENIHEG